MDFLAAWYILPSCSSCRMEATVSLMDGWLVIMTDKGKG